jgi:histidinol dehydrogenase
MEEKKMIKIVSNNDLPTDFFSSPIDKEIPVVKKIIADVRKRGDFAVRQYTQQFDQITLASFAVSKKEIEQALKIIKPEELEAIKKAASAIKNFSQRQMDSLKSFVSNDKGVITGQKIIPLGRVGCYVPGGNYPLLSTALMTIIPAKVAGVKEIIVCTPKGNPYTIAAAIIAGADKIYKVGGVQAIAAMAYGTETIPKVDKIVGPGNKYVTAAKKAIYGVCGIDMLAGPSEVMVIADDSANPSIVAADLLAQAEHDVNAVCLLVTTSSILAKKVQKEVVVQLELLDTTIASKAIKNNGYIVLVDSVDQAVAVANKKAPEHLELQLTNNGDVIPRLTNYGSLFIGKNTAEVFGDYCSGPNHTLPTGGAARYRGGLSIFDYVKIVTYQQIEDVAIRGTVEIASMLARLEGLEAHARAAEIREIFAQDI